MLDRLLQFWIYDFQVDKGQAELRAEEERKAKKAAELAEQQKAKEVRRQRGNKNVDLCMKGCHLLIIRFQHVCFRPRS